MFKIICFTVLLATGFCQVPAPGVVDDLLNIFYNGIPNLQNCSDIQVLLSNIKYILYTRENQQNGIILNTTNLNAVNPAYRVIFIIHGWLQTGTDAWAIQMKDTYLNNIVCNVIIVDWSYYGGNINVGAAVCAVSHVGRFTGDLIYNLTINPQISLSNVQINGFSLGGQVAGYAGQQVQNRTGGFKIGKIVGLDAGGPGFLNLPLDQRLDASDATSVQGIHTSNWQLGYPYAYGTVDFQVNYALLKCGARQPGCPLTPGAPTDFSDLSSFLPYFYCDHIRAAVYFTESITSTNFIGVQCNDCTNFALGYCKNNPTTVMGEHCPSTASGEKFLNTNVVPPFAKGPEGIPGPLIG